MPSDRSWAPAGSVEEVGSPEAAVAAVDRQVAAGAAMVVVHARNAWLKGLSPKENREIPPLKYDWAHRLKAGRPQLPVVLNGGIASVEAALAQLERVDGVMIGRAAYHEPYVLHLLDCALRGVQPQSRTDLLRQLQSYVEDWTGRGLALKHISRHLLGLYAGQPGGRAFRQILSEGAHRPGAGWELVEEAIAVTARQRGEAVVQLP